MPFETLAHALKAEFVVFGSRREDCNLWSTKVSRICQSLQLVGTVSELCLLLRCHLIRTAKKTVGLIRAVINSRRSLGCEV